MADASSDFSDEILPRPPTAFYEEEPAPPRPKPTVARSPGRKGAAASNSHSQPAAESAEAHAFKELLLKHFRDAQATHAASLEVPEDDDHQKEREQLIAAVQEKGPGANGSMFGAELSEQEQELLKQRHAAQQKQFQEYERKRLLRKVRMLRGMYHFLTEKEGELALKTCGGDEDEAASKLTEYEFLNGIRKKLAQEAQRPDVPVFNPRQPTPTPLLDGRVVARNRGSGSKKRADGEKVKRIRLDEALKRKEAGSMEGWSEARKRAYALIKTNPNAYYYRFNDPGVPQKNGKWSKEEQAMFMKRMKEVGVDGQWGIFSMTIPGRVGYQCSNFYRFLIQQGLVKDDNYYVDEKGKVHYLFSKGVRQTAKRTKESGGGEDDEEGGGARPVVAAKKRRSKKKKSDDDGDDYDGDDGNYHYSNKATEAELLAKKKAANPLPGFIDPITAEEVEDPCISPYGHVMGKTAWSRCLQQEPKNVCPFTKQPLRKRDLVQLTWDNIGDFRAKIVNWSGPEKK